MMTFDPRTYYITLCREVDDDLTNRIIRYMADNNFIGKDHRISRQDLAIAMFGKFTNLTDRKIRKAKENSAILSSSGIAGYYLAGTKEEIKAAIKENDNRIQSLEETNTILKRLELPINIPPEPARSPRQMDLFY